MQDEDGNFLAYAKRPIKEGEEVSSDSYSCLTCHKQSLWTPDCIVIIAEIAGRAWNVTGYLQ